MPTSLYTLCRPTTDLSRIDLNGLDIPSISKLAAAERIVLRLQQVLCHAGHAEQARTLTDQKGRDVATVRARTEKALGLVDAMVRRLHLPVLLVKGLSMEPFYPAGYQRVCNDVDLVTADIATAWALCRALIDEGFTEFVNGPAVWRMPSTGQLSMIVKLQRPADGIDVEIHGGLFAMGPLTSVTVSELMQRAGWMLAPGGLRTLGLEDAAVLFLAELHERDEFLLRDAYDWEVLLGHLVARGDREAFLRGVKRYHLGCELALVNAFCADLVATIPEPWASTLRLAARPTRLPRPWARWWYHVYPLLRARGTAGQALRTMWACWKTIRLLKINHPRLEKLVLRVDQRTDPRVHSEQGLTTFLVPIDLDVAGEWAWIPGSRLVQTPAGLYLATAYGVVTEADLEAAERLSAEWSETGAISAGRA